MSTSCRSTASPLSALTSTTRRPRSEAEVLDQRAAVAERLGRPHDAVDAILVRHREDFFGRHVGRERNALRAVDRPLTQT